MNRLLYQPLKFSICSNLVYLQQKDVSGSSSKMTLVVTALNSGEKVKSYPQVLTFFIKPQLCLFHVAVLLTTAKKWRKVKNAMQGVQSYCFCLLNMQICDVLIAVAVVISKFSIVS